jgi:hypothetical protein
MRVRFSMLVGILLVASHVWAQTPAPRTPQAPQPATAAPAPAPAEPARPAPGAAAPAPPRKEGQPINVKVDLTITEEMGGVVVVKKTVSAVAADGYTGFVREQTVPPAPGVAGTGGVLSPFTRPVPLNLDALPTILPNGKIRVNCTIQYTSGAHGTNVAPTDTPQASTDIRQNLVLILESGKSLVVSQATDPIKDRQVIVEVKATILK